MESVSGPNLIANGRPIEADSADSWNKVKQLCSSSMVFPETGRNLSRFFPRF
jgi:hypothetical protein